MDEDEHCDLIARLFAVMTADLEDAAAISAEGQSRSPTMADKVEIAERVHGIAQRTAAVADAAAALCRCGVV